MKIAQDKQLTEIVELLKTLGYDLSKDESKIFVDLVIESLDQVNNGKSLDELYDLINDKKKSPLYVELAYFVYEKGMPYIHNSLEQFQMINRKENANPELYREIFNNQKNLSAYDAAFYIVKYLDEIHTPKKGFARYKHNYVNVK